MINTCTCGGGGESKHNIVILFYANLVVFENNLLNLMFTLFVFELMILERYGSKLTFDELREFDALNENYEVNWHLKHLRSIMSPTLDELRSRSVTVKNRRRAYLDKLIFDGQYFSEDAMRDREPYLHHEYVGKFQDLSGRSMARPGERWSETLLRRSEEAILIAKIRGEQQRLGVAERDWVGGERNQEEEEEEEEEEDEEEEAKEANGGAESAKVQTKALACTHMIYIYMHMII